MCACDVRVRAVDKWRRRWGVRRGQETVQNNNNIIYILCACVAAMCIIIYDYNCMWRKETQHKIRDDLIIAIGSAVLRCNIVVDGGYNISCNKGLTRPFLRPAIESLCSRPAGTPSIRTTKYLVLDFQTQSNQLRSCCSFRHKKTS